MYYLYDECLLVDTLNEDAGVEFNKGVLLFDAINAGC